jgi:GcvH upstream region-like protein
MLDFFRKYQKIFFFFVAIVTIISFSFFGTYRAMGIDEKEIPDRTFGSKLDGSVFSEKEVKALVHLLGKSTYLIDNVIAKDFFEADLAQVLIQPYFEFLKADLEQRCKKIRQFRPYAHPQASFLNAEVMWQHFAPALAQDVSLLKSNAEEITPETWRLLTKTYLDEQAFPSEMLKRALFYQQRQFSWIAQDNDLLQTDLSLFGFHSLEDWFGERFLYLVSEFIMNASIRAEQRGYRVSSEEAYADLLQTTYQNLQAHKENVSSEDVLNYLRYELQASGLDQHQGTELWKKVLLFRRLFNEVGEGVFLDPLLQSKFHEFAMQKCIVDLYRLPEALHLQNFRSLLKLQVYLEAVAPKEHSLELPKTFFSVQEVEKRFPEIVQKRFKIELAHVKLEDLAHTISLRETWDFELVDENWQLLQKQFPFLGKDHPTKEERFKLLDRLDENTRLKVDQFARRQIILAHSEWVHNALQDAALQELALSIKTKSSSFALEGIEEAGAFVDLLERAPLKASFEPFEFFTQDEENYYRLRVLEKAESKEIMTFAEAMQEGILDLLLDQRLESSYPEVRKKNLSLFQQADGSWKPLKEVKDQVGAKIYSDLLKLIEENNGFDAKGIALETYAQYRLLPHMKAAKAGLQLNSVDTISHRDPLALQWNLIKAREEVLRSSAFILPREEVFRLAEGDFSEIAHLKEGEIAFCHLISKEKENGETAFEEIEPVKKQLANSARRTFLKELLSEIVEKKAIDFSCLDSKENSK